MARFEGWFAEMRKDKRFRDRYEAYLTATRTSGNNPENPKSWAHGLFEAETKPKPKSRARESAMARSRARRITSAIVRYEDYPT